MKHFAENLKLLRKAWGLSQTEMASKFEVSQSTYGRWEDDVEPSLDTLLALAAFFKVPFGDFITKKLAPGDVPPKYGSRIPAKDRAEEPDSSYYDSIDELGKEIKEIKDFLLKISEQMLTDRDLRSRLEEEVEKMKWQLLSLQRQEETLAQAINSMKEK